MKIFIIVILAICVTNNCFGQTEKRYFNEWGEPTSKDSSSYYRIWSIEKQRFNDHTYYVSNNQVKSYEPRYEGSLNGEIVYFHENGQVHFKANYLSGIPYGTINTYYPNGKLQKVQSYDSIPSNLKGGGPALLQYYDSAGNELVKNGNGAVVEYFRKKPGYYLSQGRVKSGLKDSTWVTYYPNGKLFYQEQWLTGKLQGGKSFNENGEVSEYKDMETQAGPEGGMAAFYKHVGGKLRYPREAKRSGIEGRVFVEFIVERDGALSNIKVIRGISPDCDQEAVRVVGTSPKWKPGLQRGQPVRSKFNLAIIFKLN